MSGYSNYSLHQKYTSVQGQILTLNQQVSNNTNPTLASVLTNSNDANNQSIQNVANIDSDTIDTQTLRIIGTSSNTSQISVNATGDLVVDDDQDVIFDIGNKVTVQNKVNSNISLDVDTANEKVAIGGAVDSANTHKLQVQGNIETSGVTLTNGLNSSSLTVTGGGHAKFTAKNGDLLLDSLTGDVVVDDVDFVVRDNLGGEKIRVDVTNDRVTVPNLTATDLTIGSGQVFNSSGDLTAPSITSTGALTASSISTTGSSTLQSTSTTDLNATELTIGNIQVFNTSGDLTASSITTPSLSFLNSSSQPTVGDKINLYDSIYSIGIAGGTAFVSSERNIDFVYRTSQTSTNTISKLRFKVDQTNPQIHSSISNGHIEFFRDANGTATKYLTLSSNSSNNTVLNSVGEFGFRASNVNSDHVTLTSSALSVNTTTDFVVANGVTEYFKVDKTANKVDMTDTDVNGDLVVTGTANTGALTASSISTTGTANTGDLTADSLTTSGILGFTSNSTASGSSDRIKLHASPASLFAIGISSNTAYYSTYENIDFVLRRSAVTDTSTTPLLRFKLDGSNPRLISNSTNSSVKDGRFEFARDAAASPAIAPYATLHSDNNNITILQTASLFLVRTNNVTNTNHFMVNGNGNICNVNGNIDFEVRDGNGFGAATSYFKVDKTADQIDMTNTDVNGNLVVSGTTSVQTPTANDHASTKLYVDQTFERKGGTYQQVFGNLNNVGVTIPFSPPANCVKMDAIVYGMGGLAGSDYLFTTGGGTSIGFSNGGSGGGGGIAIVRDVPVNASTSFQFTWDAVSGFNVDGGILKMSSSATSGFINIAIGANGGNGGNANINGGGAGGSGAITHVSFTLGQGNGSTYTGTSGSAGGTFNYAGTAVTNVPGGVAPSGVGTPVVVGGNQGEYGVGQLYGAYQSVYSASSHYASPACIVTWYLRPS
jgi:hypothetical protein